MSRDPTARFGNRVADYVRYRPGYPPALVAYLREHGWLKAASRVADIGAGTGLSTELFLDAGCAVDAVEPNAPMRAALEQALGARAGFRSVDGQAEATTLADHSVDLVAAGTAFHWFDAAPTRAEFARILRAGGGVALFWNLRRRDDAFMQVYEAAMREHGLDYVQVNAARRADETAIAAFFGGHAVEQASFANAQYVDFDGLLGRALSSSYAPQPGDASHEPMRAALRRAFDAHAVDGKVALLYDTRLYVGRLD